MQRTTWLYSHRGFQQETNRPDCGHNTGWRIVSKRLWKYSRPRDQSGPGPGLFCTEVIRSETQIKKKLKDNQRQFLLSVWLGWCRPTWTGFAFSSRNVKRKISYCILRCVSQEGKRRSLFQGNIVAEPTTSGPSFCLQSKMLFCSHSCGTDGGGIWNGLWALEHWLLFASFSRGL